MHSYRDLGRPIVPDSSNSLHRPPDGYSLHVSGNRAYRTSTTTRTSKHNTSGIFALKHHLSRSKSRSFFLNLFFSFSLLVSILGFDTNPTSMPPATAVPSTATGEITTQATSPFEVTNNSDSQSSDPINAAISQKGVQATNGKNTPDVGNSTEDEWSTGDVVMARSNESLQPDHPNEYCDGTHVIYDANGHCKGGVYVPTTTGEACAFDSDGNLYASMAFGYSQGGSYLTVFSGSGTHDVLHSIDTSINGQVADPGDIVFAANGDFLVAVGGSGRGDTVAGVERFSAAGTRIYFYDFTSFASVGIAGMDLSSDQHTLFYTAGDGEIYRYDLITEQQLTSFADFGSETRAYGIKLLTTGGSTGGLLVSVGDSTFPATWGEIKRLDGSGNVVQSYDASGEDEWDAIDFDPNGTSFWADSHTTAYRFNTATGVVEKGPFGPGTSIPVSQLCVNRTPIKASELRCGGSPSEALATEYVGDFINTATGYDCYRANELLIQGRGVPLQFDVSYSSDLTATTGPMGYGWTFNYNMWMDQDAIGSYQVHEENGSVVTFGPGSAYSHSPQIMATLTYSSAISSYIFTRIHDQTSYYFTSQGGTYKLSKIIDRNGYAINLSYISGQLGGVEDTFGHALGLNYSNGRLTRVDDKAGNRTVQLAYTSTNPLASGAPLSSITDVGGHATAFRYITNTNQLRTVTDGNGGVTTNTYYADGRISKQTDPMGRYLQFSYSAPITSTSITTRITDTLGLVTVYSYTNNMVQQVTDHAGLTDEATWNYAYQPGTPWVSSATDPLSHVWSSSWDENGNLLSETDPLSHTTQYSYYANSFLNVVTNTAGIATTYSRDTSGNLLSVSTPLTQTGETATTTYTYDPAHAGDVIGITDPLTHTWAYTYDDYGYPRSATDPLTPSHTSYTYYDNVGRMYGSVDANTNPTNYSRNSYGDLVSVTNALSYTTVYTYDAVGNLLNTRDPKGNVVTNTYNLDNQLTRVTQPDGTYSEYFYDNVGREYIETNPLRMATLYTYDDANRVVTTTDSLNRKSWSAYDRAGRLDHSVDLASNTTDYLYYANNQVEYVAYSDGVTHDVTYTYDDRGLRSSMIDGTGTTTYGYDSLDRLTSVLDGFGRNVEYHYDLASNIHQIDYPYVNGEPRQIVRFFDDANRLTTVGSGQIGATSVNFDYDANGNPTYITYTGHLQTKLDYNRANQVITSTTDTLNKSPNYTLSAFTYLRDPDGMVVSDTDTERVNNSSQLVDSSHYLTYDTRNRLVGQWFTNTLFPSNDVQVISNTWLYDNASQLLQSASIPVLDPTGALTDTAVTSSYDVVGELEGMTATLTYSSSYTTQTFAYTYNPTGERNRQVQTITGGPQAGTYTTTLGYDQANRLTAYTNGFNGVETGYAYNGDGLRMGKSSNFISISPPMTYTWDVLGVGSGGLPLLIREDTGHETNYDVSDYIYGLNSTPLIQGDYPGPIPYAGVGGTGGMGSIGGQPDAPTTADTEMFLLPDGQGNVRLVYGSAMDDVLSAFDYGAYGGRNCSLDTNRHEPCQVFPHFGYTGQYQDDESGLVYLRARYYDPSSQQFLSRDPAVQSTGQPYGYAGGNPTNVVDPSGLDGIGPNTQIPPGIGGAFDLLGKAGAGMNAIGSEGGLASAGGALAGDYVQGRLPGFEELDAPRGIPARFGSSTTKDYHSTFIKAHPELDGKVWVHHAVEQSVMESYPGVVTESEMHSIENLRGIPIEINTTLHLSQIRMIWNRFYEANPTSVTKEQLLNQATRIDDLFGHQFNPPVR